MNTYKPYLETLFNRILELRHTVAHINSALKNSLKTFEKVDVKFISGSALVISDWTGPTDEGWQINFHTGIRRITYRENYAAEIKRIISSECCYSFAQSFEALEKFLKDCIYTKVSTNYEIRTSIESAINKSITRENLPGGESLFKLIKKICRPNFDIYSKRNNNNLNFKELWTILSECRHAITHSQSVINLARINKTDYQKNLFDTLFSSTVLSDNSIKIELDYNSLDHLLKIVSEFAFQIYKLLSISENLDWEIKK